MNTTRRPFPATRAALVATVASLASSPLLLAQNSSGASALRADDELVRLDRVEVSTDRARDENYKADRTRIGTKTDTPLQDIPQSISIVTQEQILDQQMTSLTDVVRYVPGVTAHQGENNRDQVIFRGNSSSADFFLNGVRDDVQYYRDLYNLDRVEILRGPNAMIFGRGGGGGVINRASKEAEFSTLRELSFTVGGFDQTRTTLDLNQPVSRHVAVRTNALYEDAGSFRDGVWLRRVGVNPSLTLRPDTATRATISYEYFRDRRTADRGITSWQGRPAPVAIETFFGNPQDSAVRADVHLFAATIEHTFAGFTVRNRTSFGDYDRFYQNYVPGAVNAAQSTVALTAYNNATGRQNLFSQTDVTTTASTGAFRHTLLGGFELGRQRTDNFRQTGYFNHTATTFNAPYAAPTISTPVTFRQSATDANNHLDATVAAVYAQDQIELIRQLQAIVGLRFDSFNLAYRNLRNGDTLSRRDNLISPRAGLIFKPLTKVALYANYSVSYLPSSGDQFSSLTTITQQVKPEQFTNYELGTKWDLPRNFALTAAVYQLNRTNTRATDPNDPTRIVQTGSQRSQGFELGLTGTIRERLTTSLGYAYQDASITSATTAARAGATVGQVPKHTVSLWNKLQVLPQLGLGLGIVNRSTMFATLDNSVTVPGYTRVDAAVFYTLNRTWRAQLNVENVFNRTFYANADSNTNISPGAPRAIRLGLTTKF
jgi:catecholate siderophore receptor